jgi:hypothetical protein
VKPIHLLIGVATAFLLSNNAYAGEKWLSQNWVLDKTGQNHEAYTVNESKSSFGVFCSGEKCLFYLHQGLNCMPGAKYSVLMNSLSVSTAIRMECTQIGGNLFQILDPFDTVFKAIGTGQMIGFAVALQSGAFAVNRFSLLGAKPAIDRALLEAAKSKLKEQKTAPKNDPKTQLKDIQI